MPNLSHLLIAMLALVSISIAQPPGSFARTWTYGADEVTLDAELVTVKKGHAYLEETSGRITKIPLKELSDADLRHLALLTEYRDEVAPFVPKDDEEAPDTPPRPMVVIDSDVESGSVRQFRSPRWGYDGLVFSNDGAYLLTLGSDSVTIIEVNTSVVANFDVEGPVSSRSCLAMSPDGQSLLAGNSNGEVLVWGFEAGRLAPRHRFQVSDGETKSIVVEPEARYAITTHYSDEACLVDLETGKVLARYNDFSFVSSAASSFSRRGGQGLITDGSIAALIDAKTYKLLQVMSLDRRGGFAHSTAISNRGGYIAACGGRTINIWEITSGKRLPEIPVNEIQWCAEFSRSGKHLVTGGSAKVSVWNSETSSLVQEFAMQDSGYVKHVAFSPDGQHIAAIGGPIGKLVEVFRLPPEIAE